MQLSLSFKLKRPVLKMDILWCRTDICSWKISVNLSLMLENPFLVPFLCKFKHISVYFILNSMKTIRPPNNWSLSEKAMLFKVVPNSIIFKITHIFLLRRTAFPDYLSVSCDYDDLWLQILNIFLILYSVNDYIIGLFPTAMEVEYFGSRVTYKIPTDEVRNLSEVFNYLENGTVLSA